MSPSDKRKSESRLSSLANAFRRQQDERLAISAYQVGDVRSEDPVEVEAGAILIGDVLAPEVTVAGLVYGYIACRRLMVAPGGQIWGDVYVGSLELAPGAKLNGWFCALDPGTIDLLRAKELGTGDLPDQDSWSLPAELLERVRSAGADIELDQRESQRRSGIWRQLRSEAALALIARAEVEATLEQELQEAAAVPSDREAAAQGEADAAEEDGETAAQEPGAATGAEDDHPRSAEIDQLQAQLRQATAAARKYYGELLWTRAELRASRHGDQGN